MLVLLKPLLGQNLTWHRVDGFENYQSRTNIQVIRQDGNGNIVALIDHDGRTLLKDENRTEYIGTDGQRGATLVKYSAGGELIWFKDFPFLNIGRTQMDVQANGDLVLGGIVLGGTNSTFEGQPIITPIGIRGLFLTKIDRDGNLMWSDFDIEFHNSSRIETLSDLIITDNGNIYIAGGYIKMLPAPGFIRHDVEFLDILDSNGQHIDSKYFDPGPHVNHPLKWFGFGRLIKVENTVYVKASGNGFFGLSKANLLNRTQHHFFIKIEPHQNAELIFGTKELDDGFSDLVVHDDGSVTAVVFSSDGKLELTSGDITVSSVSPSLLFIAPSGEYESLRLPINASYNLRRVVEDERVVLFGRVRDTGEFEDGEGNYTEVVIDDNNPKGYIAFYTHDAKLSYLDTYDQGSDPGHIEISDVILNTRCDAFYVSGASYRDVDYDLSEEGVLLSENYVHYGAHFLAKYNNEKPTVESESVLEFCVGDEAKLLLQIKDEASDLVEVELTDPANMIDTDLVSISGATIFRELDFSNVDIPEAGITLNVRVTDFCGDFSEKEIFVKAVKAPETPKISSIGTIYLCDGEEFILGSLDGEELIWSDESVSSEISITEPGEYYGYRVNDLGCISSNSDTVTIVRATQPQIPEITFNGDLEFCRGGEVTLTSDLTDNIVWSTGETTPSITVNDSGDYFVYQLSEHCGSGENSDAITVTVNEIPKQPTIQVNGDERFCEGASVLLVANGDGNILWSNGSSENSLEISESGEFWYTIEKDDCISQISDPINIIVDKDFQFNIISDTTVCEGVEQLELKPEVSGGSVDYRWSDGSSSSTLLVDEAGSYWLEVSNGACEKPRVYIEISEACYPKVYIPNVFSPNGDGMNDTFQITGIRVVSFDLSVFNRWGNQVFHSTSLDESWDGNFNEQPLGSGSYSYRVIYGGELNGQPIQFSKNGTVSLIR